MGELEKRGRSSYSASFAAGKSDGIRGRSRRSGSIEQRSESVVVKRGLDTIKCLSGRCMFSLFKAENMNRLQSSGIAWCCDYAIQRVKNPRKMLRKKY